MHCTFATIHIRPSTRSVPLASASLAAALRADSGDDVSVSVADLYLEQPVAEQLAAVLSDAPDLLGLSIYLWNRRESLALAEMVHSSRPETVIVVGGPEVSADPGSFAEAGFIDHIVTGEGERAICSLVGRIIEPNAQHPGRVIHAELPDLKGLPSPYLTGILDPGQYEGIIWELSRGCPFNCAFCYEARGESRIRRYEEGRIRAELELFRESGTGELFILDPTFNYHRRQAVALLDLFIETAPDIHYSMEIRAEYIDDELADRFAKLNCTLQIGLQSIHPEVLRRINRTYDAEQFRDNVYRLHSRGVVYGFDLIYGLPGDSLEGFLESLDAALLLVPNHVDIFPLALLLGTELSERAAEYGLNCDRDNDWIVTGTPEFPPEDLVEAERIAAVADRFYNQGKAVSWFDILLESLHLPPSEFFQLALSVSAEAANPLLYQLQVITTVCRNQHTEEIIPVAVSLARYFWIVNNLDTGEHCRTNELAVGEIVLLNPTVVAEHFAIDPLQLISLCEEGVMHLQDMHAVVEPEEVNLACFTYAGEFSCLYLSDAGMDFISAVQCDDAAKAAVFLHNPDNRREIALMAEAGLLL